MLWVWFFIALIRATRATAWELDESDWDIIELREQEREYQIARKAITLKESESLYNLTRVPPASITAAQWTRFDEWYASPAYFDWLGTWDHYEVAKHGEMWELNFFRQNGMAYATWRQTHKDGLLYSSPLPDWEQLHKNADDTVVNTLVYGKTPTAFEYPFLGNDPFQQSVAELYRTGTVIVELNPGSIANTTLKCGCKGTAVPPLPPFVAFDNATERVIDAVVAESVALMAMPMASA